MNGLDIILLLVLLIIGMLCMIKGIIKTVFFILSMVAASVCSILFYPQTGDILNSFIKHEIVSSVLAYILIFIIVTLVFSFIAKSIKSLLKAVKLSWLDKLGGLLLGCLIGVFLNSILIIILAMFSPKENAVLKDSIFAPHILKVSKKTISILPKGLKTSFENKARDIVFEKMKKSF